MLDQNTDRMWYVIGAIVIGAAIIFAANALFDGVIMQAINGFMNDLTGVAGKNIGEIKTQNSSNIAGNSGLIIPMLKSLPLF